jgi:Domain of unknown function (DUF3382)
MPGARTVARELVLTAVLAFLILGPIVGLKTVSATGSLALEQRWGYVLIFMAIAVSIRLATLMRSGAPKAVISAPKLNLGNLGRYLGPALLILAIALPWLPSRTAALSTSAS